MILGLEESRYCPTQMESNYLDADRFDANKKEHVPAGKIETKLEIFLPTGMRGGAPRGGPPRGAGGNRGGINRPSNQ